MSIQTKPRRLLLRPPPGPRNYVVWHRPQLLRPEATTPSRNLTTLSTLISRSPAKHRKSTSLVRRRKYPPQHRPHRSPRTLRFHASNLPKPARNSAKLTHPDLTISRKTLHFRLCSLAREKFLPSCPIGRQERPVQASRRPNTTERIRTGSNVPAESATGSTRTRPNRAEHVRTAPNTSDSARHRFGRCADTSQPRDRPRRIVVVD